MNKRPMNVAMASAVAIIGGLVSFAFIAVASVKLNFEISDIKIITRLGLAVLITVLFFGFAGMAFPNGKGTYLSMIALGLFTVIAIAVTIVLDTKNNLGFGIALFIIAVIQVLLVLPYRTEKWVETDRAY